MTIKTIITCTICGCAISETATGHPLIVSINGWPEFEEMHGEFCTWDHAKQWFDNEIKHHRERKRP